MRLVPRDKESGVYYGRERLERIVNPPMSRMDRVIDWYCSRTWPSVLLVVLGIAAMAAAIFAAIYSL